MSLLRRVAAHLRQQEIGVLVAYGISASVLLVGGLIMLLVTTGAVELRFGPP